MPEQLRSALLIANLLGQVAFGLIAMTICLPSMQGWGALFLADQAQVQMTFSAYIFAFGAMQLIYGPLSDRVGRKAVLMSGMALAVLGSVGAAFAGDIQMLAGARFIQGAGSAAGMVVGRAMVQDFFSGSKRVRVMAYVGMAMGLAPSVAAIVGGQVHVHWGWQTNFLLITGLALTLFLTAWLGLPPRHREEVITEKWLGAVTQSYVQLVSDPTFLLYVSILALTTGSFFIFLGGAPIVLERYGVGPDAIGYYIMCVPVSYIVGNFITSRLIDHLGVRLLMNIGQFLALAGVGLMLILALAGVKSPLAISLPLILLGAGQGLVIPPALTGAVGLRPAQAGSAAAVNGAAQQFIGAIGGYVVGLMPHDSATNLGWLMLAFTAISAFSQLFLLQRRALQ